jgi:hypothetical protein
MLCVQHFAASYLLVLLPPVICSYCNLPFYLIGYLSICRTIFFSSSIFYQTSNYHYATCFHIETGPVSTEVCVRALRFLLLQLLTTNKCSTCYRLLGLSVFYILFCGTFLLHVSPVLQCSSELLLLLFDEMVLTLLFWCCKGQC